MVGHHAQESTTMANVEDVSSNLEKFGLRFIQVEKEVEVIVIKKKE